MGIATQIVKPNNCVLAFGIPTTKEAFFRDLRSGTDKDFVKNCCPVWTKYYFEIVRPLAMIEPRYLRLGVLSVHDVTLDLFGQLLQKNNAGVLILFSHWNGRGIEFVDGMRRIDDVVEAVPVNFEGVLDLCICHSKELFLQLQKKRPKCLVRSSDSNSTPVLWMHFYWALFEQLARQETTYLHAVEAAARTMINN